MSTLPGVSVVIIAQDEEANIGACVASARWAQETVVVDGGSRDRTAEIARVAGARVHHNRWPGFSMQWDVAIGLASQDWIFLLAADERISDDLASQVGGAIADARYDGYFVRRQTYFLDRPMRYCGWGDQRELRLFRRGRGRMDGRLVHERLLVERPVGELSGRLVHYSHPSITDYLENLNRCTTLEVQEALALGVRRSWLPPVAELARAVRRWLASDRTSASARALLRDELKNRVEWLLLQPFAPLLRFLQMYVAQRGFLDGRHGLTLSLLSAVYVFVKQIKLWEARRTQSRTARSPAAALELEDAA